jgi:MoaA/NifB/PqqE/SkfB family radical SAM enzyme
MTGSPYVVERKAGQTKVWNDGKPRIGRLDIELTERCNNDCIHCCINRPANDASALAREMTTEQIKEILLQAADLGCMQVRFTGGEPLLRPDWMELYICARRLGMKVLLFTNARLITPQLADILASVPPLETIEITVYGMHRESYEAVTRIRGSFAQFRRGVDLLLERKVPFVVKSVLLPHYRHEIDEFEAWAGKIPWMTMPPRYTMIFDLRSRRDDEGRNALIKSLRPSPQEVLALLSRNPANYRREMAEFASRFMGSPGNTLFGCGAGQGMCIDSYGYAQPCTCVRAPELTVGLLPPPLPDSIRYRNSDRNSGLSMPGRETVKITLADARARFSQIRGLQGTNPEYLRRCARCFLKGLCEQCPGKSWIENGTLDTPVEYLCEVAHTQARYLGWLGENENGWEVTVWQARVSGNA